jgi:hypothetical protein
MGVYHMLPDIFFFTAEDIRPLGLMFTALEKKKVLLKDDMKARI